LWRVRSLLVVHHSPMSSEAQVETLHDPARYTSEQLERASRIATLLNRGKLVLVEPPRR